MYLSSDYIAPAELTGYVRPALADLQTNRFTLSRWLPLRPIDDLQYRFTHGGEGLADAATYRAYDAESPLGTRPGVTATTGELPPVSRKIRLGEYDRLRQRGAAELIRNGILDDATRMTRSVGARLELARGDVLVDGVVTINENGMIATVDFGRDASHTVAPAVSWTDSTTSAPLEDMLSWQQTYIDSNGEPPGTILTSTRVVNLMLATTQIREALGVGDNTPAAPGGLPGVLGVYGLPPITTYDARVNVAGTATRVIPDDRLIMLPAAVDPGAPEGTDLGATLLGTTAESLEPDFGIEDGETPGIVAGSYRDQDPVAVWTKAAAIGLPVLANPNLSLTADVVL